MRAMTVSRFGGPDVLELVDLDEPTPAPGEDANDVDVFIDPVGGRAREVLLAHAAPFGRHLVVGNASGEDPTISGDAIWHGSNSIIGLSLGAIAHEPCSSRRRTSCRSPRPAGCTRHSSPAAPRPRRSYK